MKINVSQVPYCALAVSCQYKVSFIALKGNNFRQTVFISLTWPYCYELQPKISWEPFTIRYVLPSTFFIFQTYRIRAWLLYFSLSMNPILHLDIWYTTLCDKLCQWLVTGRLFSPGTTDSSINDTDRQDIAEILLKVALNTINQTTKPILGNKLKEQHFYCCSAFHSHSKVFTNKNNFIP